MAASREISQNRFQSRFNRAEQIYEDLNKRLTLELKILKTVTSKIMTSHEYLKRKSKDVKGKRKVLLKLKNDQKEKADALKILEEMQCLLDKFNELPRDTRYATMCLRNYQKIFQGHGKQYHFWEGVYRFSMSGSGSEQYGAVHNRIIRMAANSLPTFKWELQNWKFRSQDLLGKFNSLRLNARFDELMEKFDKLVQKLI